MRLISQNGKLDIPYSNSVFIETEDITSDRYTVSVCVSKLNLNFTLKEFAVYTTKDRLDLAMALLRERYEQKDKKYFQFPKDEEMCI